MIHQSIKQHSHNLLQSYLPSRGNVLFTTLMIALTLWAQGVSAIFLGSTTSQPATKIIPYQGYLTDADDNPLTGHRDMKFCLYENETDESARWCEQWNDADQIELKEGLFNVSLGSLNTLPQNFIASSGRLYLGITIDNDGELTPRIPVDWSEPDKVTDLWYAQPKSGATTPFNNEWNDVPETTFTFSLSSPAQVFLTYSINVHPDGDPGGSTLSTRLDVNGVPYGSTGSHYQPYSSADSNVNLNGNLVLALEPGEHTVKLQWRSSNASLSWSSDPAWGGGYGGARTITAIAFYR